MNLFVYETPEELAGAAARDFAARAEEAIDERGRFAAALAGGSTPKATYEALARHYSDRVDWGRVHVFFGDERSVAPDHEDSNYRMAREALLDHVPLGGVHRMCGELPDLDQAARRASDELRSIAGDPPRLDMALLGVGADGHIASIFPSRSSARADSSAVLSAVARSAEVEARSAKVDPVIPVYDSPKPPARRLTLAFPVLAGAGIVIVIALGATKAAVMRAALDDSGDTPVAELLRRTASSLVLLDRAAGLS